MGYYMGLEIDDAAYMTKKEATFEEWLDKVLEILCLLGYKEEELLRVREMYYETRYEKGWSVISVVVEWDLNL